MGSLRLCHYHDPWIAPDYNGTLEIRRTEPGHDSTSVVIVVTRIQRARCARIVYQAPKLLEVILGDLKPLVKLRAPPRSAMCEGAPSVLTPFCIL